MGVARIFFGENTLKIFKKNLKKIAKNTLFLHMKFWENFQKISSKIAKNALFLHIFKKFNKPCINFLRVWTKAQFVGNVKKNFVRKLLKMHYFSIFFKKFNKPGVNLLSVWTKNTICLKFWENFRKFEKIFLRKLRKKHELSIFFKKFKELCGNF